MATGWILGLFHWKPMNSDELFLIDPGALLSLPAPAQINPRNRSCCGGWKSFGCSGRDAQACDPILGGDRGRNVRIDAQSITCTLWSCPQEGRDQRGLLEPPQSFPRSPGWLMETQDQLRQGTGTWISPEGVNPAAALGCWQRQARNSWGK